MLLITFRNVVSAWSSGTGGAGIFGALFYLAFTTWFHLTPFVTLLVCMGFPVIMLVAYFFIMTARPERAPPAVEDMLDPTAEVVPLNHTPINQTEVKPSLSFVDRLHMILVRVQSVSGYYFFEGV
jgi:battenin